MRLNLNLVVVCMLFQGFLAAQPALDIGSGTGVGWMIYHQGIPSATTSPVSVGYDRTYVSLLIPVESTISWQFESFRIGLGGFRTVMYDETMIATTDRRGDRERYRISPAGKNLLFVGGWLELAWCLNPGNTIEVAPQIRLGSFDSNTVHPAWNLLGRPVLFQPGVDLSWRLTSWLRMYTCPQYVHLWKPDSPLSRPEENLHLYSLDIRAGLRFTLPGS